MNSYEEKKQRRIDYYNEKAEKFEQQSSQLAHESSKMVEAIPLGQPLLVDHYSTFAKLGKNENVTLPVLLDICEYLNCDFGDIMEAVPEIKEQ